MISDTNLNLYKVFYVCAKCKTFSEASNKLYISQPAVSKEIKKLENILNVKLFYRDRKGLKLTESGKKLFDYVDKSYNYLLAGEKIIIENNTKDIGTIKIGSPGHITSFYLLKYVEKYRIEHPKVTFIIVNGSTSELLNKLASHELDFIIDSSPIDIYPNMKIIALDKFETCFIANPNNEDNNIRKQQFIMPYEKSSMRKNLKYVLDKHNINLDIVLEVETTDLIISSVKNEIGVGYVVREAVKTELDNNQLVELNVNFPLPQIQLNLIYIDGYLNELSLYFIKNYILK